MRGRRRAGKKSQWLVAFRGEVAAGQLTYRSPKHARMSLDPSLVALAPEAEGAYATGDDELHGQDSVDFTDKLVADVDSGFGHGAAEL